MKTQLQKDFSRFLTTSGYCTPPGRAMCALSSARTLAEWRAAENASLVRLRAEPEQESYFDVYGVPDDPKEKAQIERSLELYGCYCVFAQVNHGNEAEGDDWQTCDSVGMCAGYRNPLDPFENGYVIDLMRLALGQIPQQGNVDEFCTSL